MPTHIEELSRLAATGEPFVTVTMIESKGSTPQDTGTRMLVNRTGLVHGTVGGGKVENSAIDLAREMLDDRNNSRNLVEWNLQRDLGMTCGGVVKLFFEVYNRDPWRITIFGAGHVAQSLVRALLPLNCSITCVDPRNEWLEKIPEHRNVSKIFSDDLAGQAAKITQDDFVVCMTMGHSTDRPVLSTIFKNSIQPAYLGVIGSRTKRGALIRELVEEGIERETASQFLCPIGLSIGSNQPAEIAISIVAQLLEYRDNYLDRRKKEAN